MSRISEQIIQYVKDGKVTMVRETLSAMAYMADATDFESFVDSSEYAIERMPDLFEPDREVVLKKATEYKTAAGKLMEVFSRENYDRVICEGRKQFSEPEKVVAADDDSTGGKTESSSPRDEKSTDNKAGDGLALVGLLAAVAIALVMIFARK